MVENDLVGDMQALLAKLRDPQGMPTESSSAAKPKHSQSEALPPVLLEDKLSKLLGALQSNGSDEWEGKPHQIDLGLLFCPQEESKKMKETRSAEDESDDSTAARASLDNIMDEYLTAVVNARRTAHPSNV